MQEPARMVYDHIQSWLDEELNEQSATKIAAWPKEQLRAFAKQWPEPPTSAINSEIQPLEPGVLRPITALSGPAAHRHQTIARLLLYAPAVVLPGNDLLQEWHGDEVPEEEMRKRIREQIAWLAKARPLVERGDVVFSYRHPDDAWASIIDGMDADGGSRFRLLDDLTREDWSKEGWQWPGGGLSDDVSGFNRAVAAVMGTSLELAGNGVGQPLSLDKVEEIAIGHVLRGRRVGDARMTTLERLGEFEVPDFDSDFNTLLSLRESDEWEAWRSALKEGVDLVHGIPYTENGAVEARGVLTDHLKTSLFRLDRATKRSTALGSARTGSKGFVLSGLSSVVGVAATGDPAGLLAGAVQAIGDPAWDYVRAKLAQRGSYAVLDTVIAFNNLARR